MKKATFITALAAATLMLATGYLLAGAGDAPKSEPAATKAAAIDSSNSAATLSHKVVVYYFHGNVRCVRCRKFEEYTGEAINSAFGDALKSGLLEWRVVNTDSAQNAHFVQDYQMYTKSLIITDIHKGKQTRWKNHDKIWLLAGDKPAFVKYVQDEVKAFLDTTQ